MEEKKQKILIVHNYYQLPGGEDTVVTNEKKLLEDQGHKVIFYSRNNSEIKTFHLWQKGILPFTTIFSFKTYHEVKKIIKEEQVDIVHVHNTLSLISPSVYYAAFHCGIPVVQTMHNFRLLCPGATFYRAGHICEDCVTDGLKCAVKHSCYRENKFQTLACVISTLVHRMTGIYGKIYYICLTEFNKKKLLQLRQIKRDNVFIKPNFTFNTSIPLFKKVDIGTYYLFVGRLEQIKGIDLLLKAFSQLPDIELHVVGSGREKYEYRYRYFKNIKFLGFLEKDSIKNEYQGAKAVVVTSQCYETFGMIVIEAFANGIPVIVGNIGNVGDLIEEGFNGIHYQYNDVNSLVDTIRKYESMDIEQMKFNAYKTYTDKYSSLSNYKILKKIYKTVLCN